MTKWSVLERVGRWGSAGVFLLGAYTLLVGVPALAWHAHVEERWPSVDGEMCAAEVRHRGGRSNYLKYELDLVYTYRVAGRRFDGRRWAAGNDLDFWTEASAVERAAELAPGTRVRVFHDPEDPADAVLALEAGRSAFMKFLVGALAVTIGIGGWRRKRPELVSRY